MKSHLNEKARSLEEELAMDCGSSSRELFDDQRFKTEYSGQMTRSSNSHDEDDDQEDERTTEHHIDLTDCSVSLLNPIE